MEEAQGNNPVTQRVDLWLPQLGLKGQEEKENKREKLCVRTRERDRERYRQRQTATERQRETETESDRENCGGITNRNCSIRLKGTSLWHTAGNE